jgi:hypothetical protein
MKPLEEILESINKAVDKYEGCKLSLTQDQSEILRDMAANVHFLTGYRIHYHKEWMKAYFDCNAISSAAKERAADFQVPELYTVRQVMSSANKIIDSLRTTISANK